MQTSRHPTSAATLEQILQKSAVIWRGREMARIPARPTGFAALDDCLPGGGWPSGALIEIASKHEGVGELSLTMPLLTTLSGEGRKVVFIGPPHTPYAPALVRAGLSLQTVIWINGSTDADARWAAEQVLREGLAGAVLLWSTTEDDRSLRRLQLAAETGQTFAFLYRATATLQRSSPAAMRLMVSASPDGVCASVTKVRGGAPRTVSFPLRPVAA